MNGHPGLIPSFCIAGTRSGCGKTTVALALMAALNARGLRTQAFKTGPDFIDPGHHALATGRPSHNLDGWMMGRHAVEAAFARHVRDADAAVVEGAMGLYDGFSGDSGAGSAAETAAWLKLPVVLVLDAAGVGRSAAATALGFAAFDPNVDIAGVVLNGVASKRHADILRQAFAARPDLTLLGVVPREPSVRMPSRHLGLVTAEDARLGPDYFARLASLAEDSIDIDALLARSERPRPAVPAEPAVSPIAGTRTRLAVSRDRAFCFCYEENLRYLREAGADIVFFSPLADNAVPEGVHGLYLCGGYPELSATVLTENRAMRMSVAAFAAAGGPVYAECGGFMYLMRALVDDTGREFPMAGVFPFAASMGGSRQALGYRAISTRLDSPLGPAGTKARGHEFHYSRIVGPGLDGVPAIYDMTGSHGPLPGPEGFCLDQTLGSYVHLHFASNPGLAAHFVSRCAAFASARGGHG